MQTRLTNLDTDPSERVSPVDDDVPTPQGLVRRLLRAQSPLHWAVTVVLVLVALELAVSVAGNRNFQWDVVGKYLFSPPILAGLARTLELTAISTVVGYALGALLAVMHLSGAYLPSALSRLFVWFFRGTPLLVQLLFWFNLGALYRTINLGLPFGPTFFSMESNALITPFAAAILGLGLNAGAYFSEIVRAGILSIHHGQVEAASALGLSRTQTLRTVIMPQAMRVIIPPAFNEIIGMLKYSSLVSVLAVPELLYTAQLIYSRTFQTIPMLIVASVWYLVLTTILSIVQHYIERHYAKGFRNPNASGRAGEQATAYQPQDLPDGQRLLGGETGGNR
jgi:polar amino acid transport system permease protein